jgi:glycosyltransferase involved in cell wall biosynthesis
METYCTELVSELRRHHDVTAIVLPGRANGSAPSFGALIQFAMSTVWRLLTRPGGFDAIHGGDMAVWPLVVLARLRSPHATTTLSAHGTDVAYAVRPGLRASIYRYYMRLGARMASAARIAANSRATAEVAPTLGFGKARLTVIPLATRITTARPPAPGRNLLFAGRLVRRKGLSWFVDEVLPHLPEDITLDVAGTVWDESERPALTHSRVRSLGRVDPAELPARMAAALAVVIPNIEDQQGHLEGFGLVAVEAAAAGGVVLAAKTGGFLDSVIDGTTGRLLPPQSAPDWIAAIKDVANWDPSHRIDVAVKAQDAARDYFTWERVAQQTADLYRRS